jgi:predicted nucleic acid binding AN1-type Zn finger protein
MEFHDLGKQCYLKECKQLDFLPFTCEYCKHVFCHEHWKPENHHCEKESTERKDFHTTICPVCGKIVPIKRDEDPNIRVNKHISDGCPDPGTSTSTSTKKVCQFKGCKTAQLIPFVCPKCKKSFCIKHRLDMDHNCPLKNVNIEKPRSRKNTPNSSTSSLNSRRNNTSGNNIHTLNQISEDEQLAWALQQSYDEQQRNQNRNNSQGRNKSGNECIIS